MRISIDRNTLAEKLSLSTRFTSERLTANQILQSVLLKSDGKEIHFYASNLNSYFHTKIKADTGKKFSVLIEPKKISEFLSLLSVGKIEVEVSDKKIFIFQEKYKGGFALINLSDFPLPPSVQGKKNTIKAEFFLKRLPLVLFAASRDETRPVLTGVNFLTNNEFTIVATDGFRLSLLKLEKQAEIPPLIIPSAILEEVIRLCHKEKIVDLIYSPEEKTVLFRIGDDEIYTRLIEGDFPPFERVIPEKSATRTQVDREELARGIKRIAVFARDLANVVVLKIKKEELIIQPKGEEADSSVVIEAKTEGEDQTIAFNYRFILEFLNHLESNTDSGKNIIVEILRPEAPVVFRSEKHPNYLHIIMPVRIQ